MGVFDKVDNSAKTEEVKDRVRGVRQAPMASDIQNLIIRQCFVQPSKGGALGVTTIFEVADGEHKGRELKITEYVTSGNDKGNKTFYEKKGDNGQIEQYDLPGYALMNEMAQLVLQKGILECQNEKKTIQLYNFDKKTEVPTEVDMLVEFLNKGVCGCVLHRIEDKRSRNDRTGEYEPTGQTFATNIVDKFLNPRDRKTVSETRNGIDATYQEQWLDKWKDQIDDKSTEVNNAGTKGAPSPSGENADKAPLFQ